MQESLSMTTDDFFALPAFKPDEALVQLRKQLRELRAFTERGAFFELQGMPVLELQADGGQLRARIARRPARNAEWDEQALKSSADGRRLLDEVKRRLVRWKDED
jgi:hypothetical protein